MVKENLIKWLSQFPNFQLDEVIQSEITNGDESYGVSKEPQTIVEKFIDGSMKVTEYYSFIGKRLISNNQQRVKNDKFFEEFENWIHKQDLPDLGEKIICDELNISSSNYLQSNDSTYGLYVFTIELEYRKE